MIKRLELIELIDEYFQILNFEDREERYDTEKGYARDAIIGGFLVWAISNNKLS